MTKFSSSMAGLCLAAVLNGPAASSGIPVGQDTPTRHTAKLPVAGPKTTSDWYQTGADALKARLAHRPIERAAKNIILVVGDGMGISTLTAGRIYAGQVEGRSGEEGFLSFETFPHTALVKTYNTDAQTADSAGTASALNTGVKTRIGAINTGPEQPQGQCDGTQKHALEPFAMVAERAGKATGVVSSARLTHATPAAVYANASRRGFESDADLPDGANTNECPDIASQITRALGGDGLEVALGGGRTNFIPASEGGRRKDGRNIIKEWLARAPGAAYVEDKAGLKDAVARTKGPLLGLFTRSHLTYETDKPATEPSLTELTEAAITRLSQDENGFFLMLEGGRIDHAHHDGNAARALEETRELSKAVAKAVSMVDLEETLILVTADHSHVFTMAGYPERGNPILGVVVEAGGRGDGKTPYKAKDGQPYTTLGYQNGPGALAGMDFSKRPALDNSITTALNFQQQAVIPTGSETHGGEDVALFAIGPWAHLVRGMMEQHVIYHIMRHALQNGAE